MNKKTGSLRLSELLLPGGTDKAGTGRQGLHRLMLLRSFVTTASCAGMIVLQAVTDLLVPVTLVTGLIVAIVLSVMFGFWRLRQATLISDIELFCHLLLDVVFLVVLVSSTGGVSNPLISYLLVLLAVTATLLPRGFVYSFALLGIAIYTSFLLLDLQTDHGQAAAGMNQNTVFRLHLVGMWVIFLVSAGLISIFITNMARAIRDRESNLAMAREKELRNEQLVAIGTLAAGTAHALGTPLATMAVVLTDLDKLQVDSLASTEVKDDISVLRQQVTRCKDSLNQLTRYYNKGQPQQDKKVLLSAFIADVRDYITNIHPAARVEFEMSMEQDPDISADPSLKHAVINIIENSIKAAQSSVSVRFSLGHKQEPAIEIEVRDDGPGIPANVLENMGKPFISMRKDSMGLGIFLANAAIKRLAGSIEMFNLKTGGALTLIRLPLASAQPL